MARRAVVGTLAAVLTTLRLPVQAQPAGKVWRIGFIATGDPAASPEMARIWDAFRQALRERGYAEGSNLVFEMRFTDGMVERYPALSAELVALKVDVIVVGTGPGTRAAKEVTAAIPIVMYGVSDPVGTGLVASLARPGGNVTGIADLQVDLVPKRLELLKAAIGRTTRVANLVGNFGGFDAPRREALLKSQQEAAQSLGVKLLRVQMNTPQEFETATAAVLREKVDALLLSPNPLNLLLRKELAEFASKHRLPSMAGRREEALAGILLSYGPSVADNMRHVAVYVVKILDGAKAADLPVEQPINFELVVNLKTAKGLGITIPRPVLLRADELIQ